MTTPLITRLEEAAEGSRELDEALDAFDRLYAATCGKAPMDEISKHFGLRSAGQIMRAVSQTEALRANHKDKP